MLFLVELTAQVPLAVTLPQQPGQHCNRKNHRILPKQDVAQPLGLKSNLKGPYQHHHSSIHWAPALPLPMALASGRSLDIQTEEGALKSPTQPLCLLKGGGPYLHSLSLLGLGQGLGDPGSLPYPIHKLCQASMPLATPVSTNLESKEQTFPAALPKCALA